MKTMNKILTIGALGLSLNPMETKADLFKCTACPAGYKCDGYNKTQCPAGTFAKAGASSCSSCPAGQISSAGASKCTNPPTPSCPSITNTNDKPMFIVVDEKAYTNIQWEKTSYYDTLTDYYISGWTVPVSNPSYIVMNPSSDINTVISTYFSTNRGLSVGYYYLCPVYNSRTVNNNNNEDSFDCATYVDYLTDITASKAGPRKTDCIRLGGIVSSKDTALSSQVTLTKTCNADGTFSISGNGVTINSKDLFTINTIQPEPFYSSKNTGHYCGKIDLDI